MNKYIVILALSISAIVGLTVIFAIPGCAVSMVNTEGEQSCCVAAYKLAYLEQKSKVKADKAKLIECCSKQDKVFFCEQRKINYYKTCVEATANKNKCYEEAKEKERSCIALMKTF